MSKHVPDNVGIVVYVHFLDEVRDILKSYPYDSEEWHNVPELVYTEVMKLKNIEDVCVDHQAWAKVAVDAKTWEGVGAEVDRVRSKILKILERLKNK